MNFPSTSALACLVDQEWTYRQNRRLARLLKAAKLRLPACVEDINYRQPRGLDRNLVVHLAACDWITNSQNVLITGPTGVGKTFIACALAHSACRHGFSARYYRVPRLLSELAIARGDGSYPKMLGQALQDTFAYPGRLGNGTAESCGKPRHPGDHRRSQPVVIHDNRQPTPC